MAELATVTRTDVPLKVRKVSAFLGAEVTGLDLTRPLDEITVKAIDAALATHEVLVFPGQTIGSEDLKRFGRYFGELTVHPFSTNAADSPELIVYDNKEGNPPAATDIWHSDETFRECPPMGTMLCSKIVPEIGGDTAFHSMTAAYDSLSDRMQHFISGLEAVHDFKPFKALFAETEEGWRKLQHFEEIYRPVTHPVVRVHPVSGKKVLFVNPQFTLFIKGMEEGESRALLELTVPCHQGSGASIPPSLGAQHGRVLGQQVDPARGRTRLLSAAPADGTGHNQGRSPAGYGRSGENRRAAEIQNAAADVA